jgi:hypothetical protein
MHTYIISIKDSGVDIYSQRRTSTFSGSRCVLQVIQVVMTIIVAVLIIALVSVVFMMVSRTNKVFIRLGLVGSVSRDCNDMTAMRVTALTALCMLLHCDILLRGRMGIAVSFLSLRLTRVLLKRHREVFLDE